MSQILKAALFMLICLFSTGCWAPAIPADARTLAHIHTLAVVAVESPPLEIIPDALQQQVAGRRHVNDIQLPVSTETGLYRNAGGVLIAGELPTADDEWPAVEIVQASAVAANAFPSQPIAALGAAQLTAHGVTTELMPGIAAWQVSPAKQDQQWSYGPQAAQDWYAQTTGLTSWPREQTVDAVLEIGVSHYQIFESQVSLQVMMKLIDAHSGQVIARSRRQAFVVDDSAVFSLATDSAVFKQRILALAEQLIPQTLADLGWHEWFAGKPMPKP